MITVLHRGGSSQMITVLHRANDYAVIITVLHRGGPPKDYSLPRILGYYIRNIISIDLTKKSDFFIL